MASAEADDGPVDLSMEERQTIVKYIEHLMESGDGHWDEFRCATPEETAGKKGYELKEMLAIRGLRTSGNKAALTERLHTEQPDKRKILFRNFRTTLYSVMRLIDRHGDDGHGDKPKDMCRVEYWLAHINYDSIRTSV
jgi:hypothetical protein